MLQWKLTFLCVSSSADKNSLSLPNYFLIIIFKLATTNIRRGELKAYYGAGVVPSSPSAFPQALKPARHHRGIKLCFLIAAAKWDSGAETWSAASPTTRPPNQTPSRVRVWYKLCGLLACSTTPPTKTPPRTQTQHVPPGLRERRRMHALFQASGSSFRTSAQLWHPGGGCALIFQRGGMLQAHAGDMLIYGANRHHGGIILDLADPFIQGDSRNSWTHFGRQDFTGRSTLLKGTASASSNETQSPAAPDVPTLPLPRCRLLGVSGAQRGPPVVTRCVHLCLTGAVTFRQAAGL